MPISERSRKRQLTALVLLAAGAAVVYTFVNPVTAPLVPKCLIKLVFGISCAGCGTQRALHCLLHGHFMEALHYNYFMVVSIPFVMLAIVGELFPRNAFTERIGRFVHNRHVIITFVVAVILWSIVRNIIGV